MTGEHVAAATVMCACVSNLHCMNQVKPKRLVTIIIAMLTCFAAYRTDDMAKSD